MKSTRAGERQRATVRKARWTRQRIDRVARAVVSGERGLGRESDALADHVAGLMRNRLEAVGAPGRRRGRRIGKVPGDPGLLARVLERATKHLAYMALEQEAHDGPHAR